MSKPVKNIIRKQSLNLKYRGKVDGFALQREFTDWYYQELFPELEAMVDQLAPKHVHVRLDVVKVDVALTGTENWKDSLRKQVIDDVGRQLRSTTQQAAVTEEHVRLKPAENFFVLLQYYLQNGILPWWSDLSTKAEFDAALEAWLFADDVEGYILAFRNMLEDKAVVDRITTQFNEPCFDRLVPLVAGNNTLTDQLELLKKDARALGAWVTQPEQAGIVMSLKRVILVHLAGTNYNVQSIALAFSSVLMLNYARQLVDLAPENIRSEALENAIFIQGSSTNVFQEYLTRSSVIEKPEQAQNDNTPSGEAEKENDRTDIKNPAKRTEGKQSEKNAERKPKGRATKDAEEGLFIQNAGLVILAAFLPTFFRRLQWYEEENITSPDQALYLLHYLATGKEEVPAEFELTFPKVLCGLPLEYVVKEPAQLNESQKQEADDLLVSAIEHWTILGKTSPDGLRSSFLQRNGKLVWKNDQWTVTVQQAAYDMLLNHLPWNIALIRLPWMKHMLKTEWV